MKYFLIISFIVIFLSTYYIWYNKYFSHKQCNCQIYEKKIEQYKDKEQKLLNMQKSLIIAYPKLSSYEAKYYSYIFEDFATVYNIPWEIYPSLIRIESNFEVGLRSEKGAKGIAQILESTGEEVAGKLGIKYVENITLWNELINLVIGFTYFSENIKSDTTLKEVDSLLEIAVKKYIGGPLVSVKIVSDKTYIGEYRSTVMQEYKRLHYIYLGVIYGTIIEKIE